MLVPHLTVAPEVADALARGAPVVALESTIIAHGLKWPSNLEAARALEAAVRQNAVPATIAIIDGKYRVGLSDEELIDLARHPTRYAKIALRDLPACVSQCRCGATTVSSTAHIAALAGVSVFATGGIGGVHRGPLDVSQDLLALATRRVCVVSAGVKSVLHIPATLEALEAAAVPVLVWRSDRFPAFYTRDSGCSAPNRAENAEQVAAAFLAGEELGTGMLLAVPIPEIEAGNAAKVENSIERALSEVNQRGIRGKMVTPFLLARVAELSGGESVRANIALAKNNASVAGLVALEISRLRATHIGRTKSLPPQPVPQLSSSRKLSSKLTHVLVAGVAAVDIIATADGEWTAGASNPGRVVRAVGGVACNVARAAAAAGAQVAFAGAIGADAHGMLIRSILQSACVTVDALRTTQESTPVYCAVHSSGGELAGAVADMPVNAQAVVQAAQLALVDKPRVFVLDANLPVWACTQLARAGAKVGAAVFIEPTSVAKSVRVLDALKYALLVSPNVAELSALAQRLGDVPTIDENTAVRTVLRTGVRAVVVTRGERGAALYHKDEEPYELAAPTIVVRNTSGAGDALLGSMAAHVAAHGINVEQLQAALRAGMAAAARACASEHSVAQTPTAKL